MASEMLDEKAIFNVARQIGSPDARGEYLRQACKADSGLRERVQDLLRAYEEQASFLESPPPVGVTPTIDQPAPESPGTVIGPYKLLQQIGEGGMGVVWMAEQTQPVQRKVALKVIKPGMDTAQVIARFESERQALAIMDHPHIAKVHDAGATESGRPYFVMELVKGVPITEFCDRNHSPLEARLKLFIDVCHAIQHAHHKGIIHRDIKPSNVMVTLHDGVPVVKVIDFGVAKATAQKLTERTLFTAYGQMIGTPAYMSPEQAEMSGLDVDTRSDVYSLGVLLYELLTGTTPLESKRLREAGYAEMQRLIREEESQRPSTRLSALGDSATVLAGNRGLDVKRLVQLLAGDLDWVAMKALDKDRNRRYGTPGGFAEDIERYLRREAILARPPSTIYKLKKFTQRNRVTVLTVSLVAAALLVGISTATWQAVRATRAEAAARLAEQEARQAQQAEAERAEGERLAKLDAVAQTEQAQKRLRQIEKANDILASIFENLDPREIAKAELPLQAILVEKLDKAVEQLEAESIGDPLVVAAMQVKFGSSLLGLGKPGKAIVLLEKARATRQANLGPDHPDTLMSMNNLAAAYQHDGKWDLALPIFEETLKLQRAKLGPEDLGTLHTMANLATAYGDAGKLDLALPLSEETLKLRKATLGPEHPATLYSMDRLAMAYQAAGRLDLSLPLFEEALKLKKAALGSEHPDTLISMNNLGLAYRAAGTRDLALPLFEETHKLMKAKLGSEHPHTLASMNNLALAYRDAGKLDLALPLHEDTLKLMKAERGPEHPSTLASMNNLAMAYKAAGKLDLALQLLEDTLKLTKSKFGPEHPDTLTTMGNLASAYQAAGKLDLALPLSEETLKLQEATLGPEHPNTLKSMNYLISAYRAAGKLDLTLPLHEQTLKFRKAKLGPEHPDTIASMNAVTFAYLLVAARQAWFGQDQELAATCVRALELAESNDPITPVTLERVSKVCSLNATADTSLRAAALMLARQAVERGQDSVSLPWFKLALGMAEYRSGHFAEADAALIAFAGRAGTALSNTGAFYRAMSLFRQGKPDEARQLTNAAATKMKPLPKDEKDPLADKAGHDDLILWLAYKEAKELIGFDAAPATAPLENASPPRKNE